jgi:hypothetical protein
VRKSRTLGSVGGGFRKESVYPTFSFKKTAPVWRRPGKGMGKNMKSIVIISAGLPAGWEWRGILNLVPKLMGSPPFFPVDD